MEIAGHFKVEAINMLPTSLERLDMVIADDQDARDWSETLPKLSQTLICLKRIGELLSFVMLLQRKCFRQGVVNCFGFMSLHTTWYIF